MILSDTEAEARLTELRRRRDALEREIADLVLYLDLGRRLGGRSDGEEVGNAAPDPHAPSPPAPRDKPPAAARPSPPLTERAVPPADPAEPEAGLSETVLARRYGRALIEAALAALEEAGRPLHASEILARLTERGFSLPGADPVAALNTRLWKRSGPGGPLRRLGEAVYAPAEAEEG